ncbi:MAG: hypothetical protein WBC33_01250 [Conexibacter sp.]
MTRDELSAALAALQRALDSRVEVYRVTIAPDGTVVKRIYCGAFSRPPDWQPKEKT